MLKFRTGNFPAGSGICLGSCGAGKIPVISSTYPMMIEPGKDVATVNACLVSGKGKSSVPPEHDMIRADFRSTVLLQRGTSYPTQ